MAMNNPSLASLLSFLPPRYRPFALPAVGGALAVAIVFVVASTLIQQSRESRTEHISSLFWEMSDSLAIGEVEEAQASYAALAEDGDDAQVAIAALRLGSGYYQAEEYVKAQDIFQEVIDLAGEKSIRDLARIRLAKSLMATGDHLAAQQALLEVESLNQYVTVVSESLIGDIHFAQRNLEDAQIAYESALEQAIETRDQVLIGILDGKLDALASARLQSGLPLAQPEEGQ